MAETDGSVESNDAGGLFEAFARGDLETFLSDCADSLLVTVWGTSPGSTLVPRSGLGDWYAALSAMTGASLRTEVVLSLDLDRDHVVILRHTFLIDGETRRYDTVNLCTFREGQLTAWFAYPMDLQEYADAWGTSRRPVSQLV